jgi:hypothetical protein
MLFAAHDYEALMLGGDETSLSHVLDPHGRMELGLQVNTKREPNRSTVPIDT